MGDELATAAVPAPPPSGGHALVGLSQTEAQQRLLAAGRPRELESGRSYASIVRANVLTVFNAILAGFGAVTLIFGMLATLCFWASSSPTLPSGSRRRCGLSMPLIGSRCWLLPTPG